MSTQLRELFEERVDSDVPLDFAERVISSARTRRRQRVVVGGAVLATAAVVLGVLVAVSDIRSGEQPRPTDVANIPESLPQPRDLPRLEPGALDSASFGYIVSGQLVIVDASTGSAYRNTFGWLPDENGNVLDVAAAATDVALSPDGERAVVTVESGQPDVRTTVRILTLSSGTEAVLPGVTPVEDSGGPTLARPSVYAWTNDSSSFYCACAEGHGVPTLLQVELEDGFEPQVSSVADVSPLQVAAGTAGLSFQLEPGGRWSRPESASPFVEPIVAYAFALGRRDQSTYLANQGWGFTVGDLESPGPPVAVPNIRDTGGRYLAIPTDVEAVVNGFVAVIAVTPRSDGSSEAYGSTEQSESPAEAISDLHAYVITPDGVLREFTAFPPGTFTASFASDLVAP